MATNTLKTIIKLRRDIELNYDKIGSSYIPMKGEVVLVDTYSDGLRAKVGDGITPYKNLEFADTNIYDAIDSVVMRGYYMNNLFWTDSSYTVLLPKSVNRVYIDINSETIFHYDGSSYISVNSTLPTASDAVAGIMKLYDESGQNTDGSMTQKSVTDGVTGIKFSIDEEDKECLVLDIPWLNI